jgi:exodeoxyribonuclease-3
MRIATWNVNSVKQRVPRLLPWLDERQPDVVCLQETKLADDAFSELLGAELSERGYEIAAHGEPTWNGVAILSRVGLDEVVAGVADGPGFPHAESRAISATCGGIRVVSVYVPNGRVPGSEHYAYKLAWLAALRKMLAAGPEAMVVCGDMNIAPTDDDVFDHEAYIGQTSCAIAGRTSASSPTGTTARGCSTRTSGCGSTWCSRARRSPTASGRRGSTARRARAAARATTRR